MHNDFILLFSYGGFYGAINEDGKVFIWYTSLIKYMTKHIKPMSNRNNITSGCETCIIAMLLQYCFNKWWLTQLEELDKLYINAVSTMILQRSKID